MQTEMRKIESHRDHRVLAVYDDSNASVFPLPHNATLGQLCEMLAMRAPIHGLPPRHVEVNLGR
jgi:hypothetical protein